MATMALQGGTDNWTPELDFCIHYFDGDGTAAYTRFIGGEGDIYVPEPQHENDYRLLAHELAHVAMGRRDVNQRRVWIDEGAAELVSYRSPFQIHELVSNCAAVLGPNVTVKVELEGEGWRSFTLPHHAFPRPQDMAQRFRDRGGSPFAGDAASMDPLDYLTCSLLAIKYCSLGRFDPWRSPPLQVAESIELAVDHAGPARLEGSDVLEIFSELVFAVLEAEACRREVELLRLAISVEGECVYERGRYAEPASRLRAVVGRIPPWLLGLETARASVINYL